jgi:hypothetical protein
MARDFPEGQAEIRKLLAPPVGDPAASRKVCVDCGTGFWDWTVKWRTYCADCGAERMRAGPQKRRKAAPPSLPSAGAPAAVVQSRLS